MKYRDTIYDIPIKFNFLFNEKFFTLFFSMCLNSRSSKSNEIAPRFFKSEVNKISF